MPRRRAPGEGSIHWRKTDRRWVASVTLEDGSRIARYVPGNKTDKDAKQRAEDALTELRRDVEKGLRIGDASQPLAEFLERWLEESIRPNLAHNSWRCYAAHCHLHIIPELGHIPLAKLLPQHVSRWLAKMTARGVSPSLQKACKVTLGAALHQAQKWEIIERNVAALVDNPRVTHTEHVWLDRPQVARLIEACQGHHFEAVYIVAVTTGLRLGEVLGLRWSDLDLDAGVVHVVRQSIRVEGQTVSTGLKTAKSRREVPLMPVTVDTLKSHRIRQLEARLSAGTWWHDRDGLVFTTEVGLPVTSGMVRKPFFRLLASAGLPRVRLHDLRHSYASLFVADGVDLQVIQKLLGHASIAITAGIYAHLSENTKREAVGKVAAKLSTGLSG